MSESFEFGNPSLLTVGAQGKPGQRVFFLQAREGGLVATLKMEKAQVAALAAWIVRVLEDRPAPAELPPDHTLEPEPFTEPAWVVGSLGGSYDTESDRIVIVAAELVDEPEEDEPDLSSSDDGAVARFLGTREQMAALAIRATRLVEAGRPPCPLCGYPLEEGNHQCPKTNGHRPPRL